MLPLYVKIRAESQSAQSCTPSFCMGSGVDRAYGQPTSWTATGELIVGCGRHGKGVACRALAIIPAPASSGISSRCIIKVIVGWCVVTTYATGFDITHLLPQRDTPTQSAAPCSRSAGAGPGVRACCALLRQPSVCPSTRVGAGGRRRVAIITVVHPQPVADSV